MLLLLSLSTSRMSTSASGLERSFLLDAGKLVAHFGAKLAVLSSSVRRKDAKALIAKAVDDELGNLGFGVFLF